MSHQLKLCKITDSGILFRGHEVRLYKFNKNDVVTLLHVLAHDVTGKQISHMASLV